MIEYIDVIGRWAIIVSNLLLNVFRQFETIIDYVRHRQEFKAWKQQKKAQRDEEKRKIEIWKEELRVKGEIKGREAE